MPVTPSNHQEVLRMISGWQLPINSYQSVIYLLASLSESNKSSFDFLGGYNVALTLLGKVLTWDMKFYRKFE